MSVYSELNANTAILDAVRPNLATSGGPMIIISTPYAVDDTLR